MPSGRLERLVDRDAGGVWAWADPQDPTRHAGKAHLWKNGYHEAEHALVMAITAATLRGEAVDLCFAPPESSADLPVRPCFFAGEVVAREHGGALAELPGHVVERVSFARIR